MPAASEALPAADDGRSARRLPPGGCQRGWAGDSGYARDGDGWARGGGYARDGDGWARGGGYARDGDG